MQDKAASLLAEIGLPTGDQHPPQASSKRFHDGGLFRVEIPSTEGPDATATVVEEAARLGIRVDRISSGSGVTLTTDAELRALAQLGAEASVEICPFVGPRAPWEGTASPLAPDGGQIGWRHTGMDQLRYALADVERLVNAGLRSVLVADEGLIYVIARGRENGHFPADLVIKGSALLGVANAASVWLLEQLGLDSLNVPSDLSPAKLGSVRQRTALAIDLYIESPDGLGGFTRYHELAQIVRVAAPVHLKFGLRNAAGLYPSGAHLASLALSSARERVRRAAIGLEHLDRARIKPFVSNPGKRSGIPQV